MQKILMIVAIVSAYFFSASIHAQTVQQLCIDNNSRHNVLVVFTNGYRLFNPSDDEECFQSSADFYRSTVYICPQQWVSSCIGNPKYLQREFGFRVHNSSPFLVQNPAGGGPRLKLGTTEGETMVCADQNQGGPEGPVVFTCDTEILDN